MTKPIEEIVQETIDNLNQKLGNATDLNEEKATAIIKECFDTAFSQISSDEERNTLYKKLSLVLHSDKFKILEKVQKSYAILNQLKIADLPFTELKKYQQPGFFSKIASNPVEGTLSLILFLGEKLARMSGEYKRYPEPIRTMVNIISWNINIVLIASLIALAVLSGIIFLVTTIVDTIQRYLINILSSNQYVIEFSIKYNTGLERLTNDPVLFAQAKRTLLEQVKISAKKAGHNVENMGSVELEDLYLRELLNQKTQNHLDTKGYTLTDADLEKYKKEAKDEFNNLIKKIADETATKTANVTGFAHLAVICKAMFTAIAKPLPETIGGKLAAIFIIKPLQVLATPFVLIGTVTVELARWGNTLLIIGGIGAAAAIKVGSLVVLNLPLYLLDAVRFIVNKIQAYVNAKTPGENGEKENQKDSAPNPSQQPEPKPTASKPGVDSEPGHFGNPLHTAAKKSEKPEDLDNGATFKFG